MSGGSTEEKLVLRALRAAWVLIATDPEPRPRLGFAQPKMFSSYQVHDYWTLFALAREMGVTVSEVKDELSSGFSSCDRLVLTMRREAAYRLVEVLSALPRPVVEVVQAKARGDGWRKINKLLPGRAFFSVMDDLKAGIKHLVKSCGPEVRELGYLVG